MLGVIDGAAGKPLLAAAALNTIGLALEFTFRFRGAAVRRGRGGGLCMIGTCWLDPIRAFSGMLRRAGG